ncbi:MAG: DUF1059 domain-containing protein [Candidatus Micrarchaeales archaeon]
MAMKMVKCDCGFEVRAPDQEEQALIAATKFHLKQRHGMPEPSDEEVRKRIKTSK